MLWCIYLHTMAMYVPFILLLLCISRYLHKITELLFFRVTVSTKGSADPQTEEALVLWQQKLFRYYLFMLVTTLVVCIVVCLL